MGTKSGRGRRAEANNSYKNLDSRLPVLSYQFSVGLNAVATHVGSWAAGIESGKM
jgi:hypothetical protein